MQIGVSQIRAFVTVAETGNFTRAADILGITQPALTQRVHQFESALGEKMFARCGRGSALTDIGRELLPHFSKLLNEFEVTISGAHNLARRCRVQSES